MLSQFWTNQSLTKSLYSDFLEPVCKKYRLTRMELDVLIFLANNPQFTTATDIVENRKLTKSHVSLAVNSLVKKGYLKKEYTKSNRKTTHLSILSSACDIIQDGRDAQKNFASVLFKDFSPEDHRQMIHYFERITQNMQDYYKEEKH